jgi:hypothetical protein
MSTIHEDQNFEIKKKVKKYLKYDLIAAFTILLALFWLPISLSIFDFLLPLESSWMSFPTMIGGFVFLSSLSIIASKIRNRYFIEDDEWLRFYSNLVITSLEGYINTKDSDTKKELRKQALNNTKNLLSTIENWNIGHSKLVKSYVKDSVSNLKTNLRYRIIPALENCSEEVLKNVKLIMRLIYVKSKNLTVESIDVINTQISKMIDEQKPYRIGYISQCSRFLRYHKVIRHSLTVSVLTIICVALGYIGVSYIGITKEYGWIGAITIFVCLLGIYFARQPREEK